MRKLRFAAPLLATAASLALMAGCSGSGADSAATAGGGSAAEAPAAVAVEESTPEFGYAEDAGGGQSAPGAVADADAGREVITTGTASVITEDPLTAAQGISSRVAAVGGRVERREERSATEYTPARASLTLRIPTAEMTGIVNALASFGEVEEVNISREDVTAVGADLDARIQALETSTARLRELMANAGEVGDLLDVERELSSRQSDLDALRARRAALTDQVAMSTLDVYLRAPEETIEPAPVGFRGALSGGWNSLETFGSGLLIVLGVTLPWLISLAVLGLLLFGVIDLLRRAARRRRPAPATAVVPPELVETIPELPAQAVPPQTTMTEPTRPAGNDSRIS